jgi:hypothetical protein
VIGDRTQRTTATNLRTVVDPKMSLSLWLRAGRAAKGMSLDDVAKITKIQPRILERLEAGKLEGLPAEVFVRGFVRSYARCCGLDEAEALERYAQAAGQPTSPSAAVTRANALVESMSELAPVTASRAPRVLSDAQLASGSSTNFGDAARQETVVETFLPVNGTLVEEKLEAPASLPIVEDLPIVDAAPVVDVVDAAPAADVVDVVNVVEAAPVVEETSKKKRGRRGGKGRKRKQIAEGTPSSPMPVVTAESIEAPAEVSAAVEASVTSEITAEGSTTTAIVAAPADATTDATDVTVDVASIAEATTTTEASTETWSPKMPVVTPSVPWRRPTSTLTSRSIASSKAVVPSIVIDDSDPDSAERELEDRAAAKEPVRRSFLTPILLDREDRSARQGGLTLAVIILLIAATLTLSYLMRRPSSTGDGVTMADGVTDVIAAV